MAVMFYKLCGSCGNKIKIDEVCSCKKRKDILYNRERKATYKTNFYKSNSWRKLSKQCKLRDNGLDLFQLKLNNKIVKGELSHHIEEVEDNPERKLDLTNLIYVSKATHNFIHSVYNKSEEDKRKLQHILRGMVGG